MATRTRELRTFEIRAVRSRERTRNGNSYLPCETSGGVAAFWGSDKNLGNVRSIEAGRVPFTVTCECISANWSSHDLWVPENSRIEIHVPAKRDDSGDESVRPPEQGSPPPNAPTMDAKVAESWMVAMELVDPRLRGLVMTLFRRRVSAPVVGFELIRGTGAVLAESELAWPERKVAVLLPEKREWKAPFEGAGWWVIGGDAERIGEAVAAALDQ